MTVANRTHFTPRSTTKPLSAWPDTRGQFCKPTTDPLGQTLRAQRLAAGLSLTELAQRAGVDRGHISKLELGKVKRPTPALVARLVAALGAGE